MKTHREEEGEELPETDNARNEVRSWEEQVPEASWDENEKKLEIRHFHRYHFLLYFKSESVCGGSVCTFL